MFIEDYILAFATYCFKLPDSSSEFILSLSEQIHMGRTLTTRQGYAAISSMKGILARPNFKNDFPKINKKDCRAAIEEKRWKNELRVSVERRREARYLGDNIVALSFPAIPEMKKAVRNLNAVWREQLYLVTVKSSNLDALVDFLGVHSFDISTELEQYLAVCLGSKKQISHVIAVDNGAAINVCDDDLFGNFILHICGGQRI